MTEKDYNPEQKQTKAMKQQEKVAKQSAAKAPTKVKKKSAKETKTEVKAEKVEVKEIAKEKKEGTEKPEKKKEEKKPGMKETAPKKKKTEAIVNSPNAPLSTKVSTAVCKFIVGKKIDKAVSDLEEVVRKKKAIPMKGEIPHRKGLGKSASGAGRYPKKTSEYFIKLLKSLAANAVVNELENPVIAEAIANIGVRPYGRFGRQRKKRTHIKLIAKSKNKFDRKKR